IFLVDGSVQVSAGPPKKPVGRCGLRRYTSARALRICLYKGDRVRAASLDALAADRDDRIFVPPAATADPSPHTMRPVAPCSDTPAPRRATDADSDTAGRTALLVDALRRGRKANKDAASPAPELAAAQASLERRVRAHMERGSVRITLTDNRYTMIS